MSKALKLQFVLLFISILLNFIAQAFYFYHLYYNGFKSLETHLPQIIIIVVTLAFFLVPSLLLYMKKKVGYYLLLSFLIVEFLFYLMNFIEAFIHYANPFFQLNNPDMFLRVIFVIGYMNLFSSGYLLLLIIRNKKEILTK